MRPPASLRLRPLRFYHLPSSNYSCACVWIHVFICPRQEEMRGSPASNPYICILARRADACVRTLAGADVVLVRRECCAVGERERGPRAARSFAVWVTDVSSRALCRSLF